MLDVGGGTVDVSVLRREPETQVNHTADGGREGFRVLATRGDPGFGGADVDQALLEHVGALVSDAGPEAWRELVEGRELAGRRRRRVLRQDVRGAKETLSRHVYTDVPLPEPFWDAHVTREDLERLIAPPFDRVVEMVSGALTDACLRPKQLTGVFLVGGSSRIPLISRLVHERIGVVPTTLDQPETVVARGAIRAVLGGPERAGASPGTKQAAPPLAQRPTSVVGPEDVPPGAGKGRGPAPQQPPAQRDPQRDPQPDPRRPRQPPPQGSPQGSSQAGPQVSPQADRPLSPPRGHQLPGAVAGPVPGTGTGRQPPSVPGTFAASAQQEQGSSRRTWPWLLGGGLGLAAIAGIGAAMLVLPGEDEEEPRRGEAATIGLHDFRFEVPSGWRQTGYDGEAQTVVVQPDDAADGDDLVAVQQFDLYRDIDDDFETFADELEQLVDEAGERYASFDREASYAGRDVIYYTEPGQQQATDWFVVAEGRVQISVGCQYTEAGLERVEQACEQVVRTLAITG